MDERAMGDNSLIHLYQVGRSSSEEHFYCTLELQAEQLEVRGYQRPEERKR